MNKIFPKPYAFSLRFWLFVIFVLGVISRSVFMYFYYPQKFYGHAISASRSELLSLTDLAAFSTGEALRSPNAAGLESVLSAIRKNPEIRYVVVTDAKQKMIAGYNIESAITLRYGTATAEGILSEDGQTMMAAAPVTDNGTTIGYIHLGLSLDAVLREVQETKDSFALGSLLIFLVGIPFVYYLTHLLIKPFRKMAQTSLQIAQGDFSKRLEKVGYTEVNMLADGFNQMVDHFITVQEQVRSANRTLEIRINERTKDLQLEIQQHKKTEAALRESEERFRALVELSPDAIVIHSNGGFIFMNSAALTLFRVPSMDRLNGRSLFEFLTPAQMKQFEESLHQILHGSIVNILSEFTFLRDDGSEFIAEVSATKLLFGGTVSIQIAIRDITERVKNERARVDLEQQLLHIQKKEIISTLASGLAHDILNILGIIGTAINKLLFLKDVNHASVMESAEQISKASERGRSLVRQLLSFAKKSELNFSAVQMNAIVNEITAILQRIFPASVTLSVDLTNDLPVIRADNNQVHQALLNLCLNARDAVGDNGSIAIETKKVLRYVNGTDGQPAREFIRLSVIDSGIGMNEEIMKKIYEPFFTTKEQGTGSGLGLAMVKGIMENHRGMVEVESTVGKGSSFHLFFPV